MPSTSELGMSRPAGTSRTRSVVGCADRRGADPDQEFVGRRKGPRDILESHDLRSSEAAVHGGLHGRRGGDGRGGRGHDVLLIVELDDRDERQPGVAQSLQDAVEGRLIRENAADHRGPVLTERIS
jgi:hypothetical protein